jgi:hypothetical protein
MADVASAIETATAAQAVAAFSNCAATLDGVAISGIFDNGSAAGLGNMMLGSNPTFTCSSSDAPSSKRNKTLVVNSVSYTVREIKPDGTGMSVLELEQV